MGEYIDGQLTAGVSMAAAFDGLPSTSLPPQIQQMDNARFEKEWKLREKARNKGTTGIKRKSHAATLLDTKEAAVRDAHARGQMEEATSALAELRSCCGGNQSGMHKFIELQTLLGLQ
jgi:hypothetical protein